MQEGRGNENESGRTQGVSRRFGVKVWRVIAHSGRSEILDMLCDSIEGSKAKGIILSELKGFAVQVNVMNLTARWLPRFACGKWLVLKLLRVEYTGIAYRQAV